MHAKSLVTFRHVARFATANVYWVAYVIVAFVVLTAARSTLADQYHVPTGSMWPTIVPGDRIFVDKSAYGIRIPFTTSYVLPVSAPTAGDVVIFADPRGGSIPLVKRVAALSGQTVSMEGGVVFIDGEPQAITPLENGSALEELQCVKHRAKIDPREHFEPVSVPQGYIFVLGDNRAKSLDSRELGPIPLELLRGQVVAVGQSDVDSWSGLQGMFAWIR